MLRATILAAAVVAVPALAQDGQNAVSPDGRWRADVRADRAATDDDPGISALWLTDTRTGASRKLFVGRPAEKIEATTATFSDPHWSLDGGFVYINADAWATSSAVHQVEVTTGAERYVIEGGVVGVLRTGPYRGYLLVQQHRYWPQGGSYDPVSLYQPNGKRILMVPGSDKDSGEGSVDRWLKTRGWTAD